MSRSDELDSLELQLYINSFDDVEELSLLLKAAMRVFPVLNLELCQMYDFTETDVALWIDGLVCPPRAIIDTVVSHIRYRIREEKKAMQLERESGMVVYHSAKPSTLGYINIPIYAPLVLATKGLLQSLIDLLRPSATSINSLKDKINQAILNRELRLQVKVTRHIKRCNKQLIRALSKNNYSFMYCVGKKTHENVRVANSVRDYLLQSEVCTVEVSFDFVYRPEGEVYLEVTFQR